MSERVELPKDNPMSADKQDRRVLPDSATQTKADGQQGRTFFDNRPVNVSQRRLQGLANNSHRVRQLKAIQEMADDRTAMTESQGLPHNYSTYRHPPVQKKKNQTGLPDDLKAGMEQLSGYAMDDVRVHYNSDKPAQLQAHAYTQGAHIHVAPGQERHLAHETWHVIQQMQGRVSPTRQLNSGVNVNDNAGLEREADVMGSKALQAKVKPSHSLKIFRTTPSIPPIQRVIAGLEYYTNHENIPDEWVTAYHNDITDNTAHLSDENLLQLYSVLNDGRTPDQDNIAFNHEGGNHWTLTHNGDTTYQITPDGSCGVHAVHLASRLRAGETGIKTDEYYKAPDEFVTDARQRLQNHLTQGDEEHLNDTSEEAKRLIAEGIDNSEYIFTTGFGPQLQGALRAALVEQSPESKQSFFESFYANYWANAGMMKTFWPKPSVAKKMLDKGFFTADEPLHELVTHALNEIYQKEQKIKIHNPKKPSPLIKRIFKSTLSNTMSSKESALLIKGIPSRFESKRAGRRRLKGNRLGVMDSKEFRKKMQDPKFRQIVMKASRKSRMRFKKDRSSDITRLISGGDSNLRNIKVDSSQLMEALFAFTESDSKVKNDLQVGSGHSQYTSIGKGGLQVKGLSTYPDEILWFQKKIEEWKVNPKELFQAMQLHDVDTLLKITNNNVTDLKHLLSFHTLQIEEIYRGVQFGIGQSAHYKLGFHGQVGFAQYLKGMPMYEGGATTNVTQSTDWEKPYDSTLWNTQVSSMFEGIQQLAEMEIPKGEVYDERTRQFIEALEQEEIQDEPSEQLVNAGYDFMRSPNPYENESDMEEDSNSEEK